MAGKSSALADIAAQIGPNEGRAEAHTPVPHGAGAQNDLLGFTDDEREAQAFDDEMAAFAGQEIAPPKRRAGRPPGTPNRATQALKRLLLARGYRDPAEFLAAIITKPTGELARDLCDGENQSSLDALRLQIAAARELLPYFHQKMPVQVEHHGDGQRPVIIINDGPAGGLPGMRGEASGAGTMSIHEYNQGVVAIEAQAAPVASDEGAGHDSR